MKYFLLAILFFFNSATAQDYTANWVTVPKEVGVVNYQIQVKKFSSNTWTTIATIAPKRGAAANVYEYTLPTADNYIRVKALMSSNIIYTVPIKVINTNVVITKANVDTNRNFDNLSFTSTNEAAVNYYSIERNNNNSSKWFIAGKLMQTGKKYYTVNIWKSGSNRKYRLISIYKNGIKSEYINFKD